MQLNGSGNIQPGQQLSSAMELQQKYESAIDDRLKFTTPSVDVKPNVPPMGQTSIQPTGDASANQKVTHSPFS